ncbi:MAG: hypothetical protein ACE5FP_07605 [Gemmatimonadota bacterium]
MIRSVLSALIAVVVLAVPNQALAQDHGHQSPYAGEQARDIKALSSEEIESLLDGQGMSQALSAELNGLPGPTHVLQMRSELGLTLDQERRVRDIFDGMQSAAREAGARIVDLERRLDRGPPAACSCRWAVRDMPALHPTC